jgi:hypothetical protein
MPTLLEVQRAMRQSIIDRTDGTIVDLVVGDGMLPADRLRIYRGNYAAALVEALRLSYPAIEKLVGTECFEGCVRQFIQAMPPHTPWLYEYGGEFSEFLANLPSLAQLSYLPDVARLEWAINGVLHARDHEGLDGASLAALAETDPRLVRFEPHPAVRLLQVSYPVDVIWRAVLEGDDEALGKIDLSEGPQWLLIERGNTGLQVARLEEAEWRFTAALFAGGTLDAVIGAATDIDAPSVLAGHFRSRRIAAAHFDGVLEGAWQGAGS